MLRLSYLTSRTGHLTGLLLLVVLILGSSQAHAALEAAPPTSNSITLTWTAPGDDGTSGQASVYDIRYATDSITDANWDAATQVAGEPSPQSSGATEEFTVTGLNPNTTYYFAIKVGDEIPNWSTLSNVVSRTTLAESTPPSLIADLATESPSSTSLTLTWTATGDDGSSGTASQYDIRWSLDPIDNETEWAGATPLTGEPTPQVAGASESMVVNSLTPNTTYHFAIKAADEVPNWSALSNSASGTTSQEAIAPAIVSNLGASSSTETSVTLTWTAPGDDGNSGTATEYDIRYSTFAINDANWAGATQISNEPTPGSAGSMQTVTISGLNSETSYFFALKTADEVPNWSGLSNVATGSTGADATPPANTSTLVAVLPTMESLTLVWTAPGDDGNSGTATQYDIRYSISPINTSNWAAATQVAGEPSPSAAGNPDTVTVSGLLTNTRYYFALRTADENNNWSGLSNIASNVTEQDDMPPASIQDLSAVPGQDEGQIDLSWTAPGDDGLEGAASLYVIRFSLDSIDASTWEQATVADSSPPPQGAGTAQDFCLESLLPGREYFVAVRSYDDAGNVSDLSNVTKAEAKVDLPLDNDETYAEMSTPVSGSSVNSSRPVLSVVNSLNDNIESYLFQIAEDSGFFSFVASEEVLAQDGELTQWQVPVALNSGQTYYWRVAAEGVEFAEAWSFSVEAFAHAYPNPVRFRQGHIATFSELTPGSDVVLISVSGGVVRQWSSVSNTELQWDGRNESGNSVSSGAYLWYVTDPYTGDVTKGKLLVVN